MMKTFLYRQPAGWLAAVGCVLSVLGGCKEAPGGQAEAEYAMLTLAPSDQVVHSSYPATIRGRQDIDIYPQVSGTFTRLCVV